jgi:hypothetical protein
MRRSPSHLVVWPNRFRSGSHDEGGELTSAIIVRPFLDCHAQHRRARLGCERGVRLGAAQVTALCVKLEGRLPQSASAIWLPAARLLHLCVDSG